MDQPVKANESNPPPDQAKPKKNMWERVITITPVVMTVVATLLASQSTGEMTRAQYHRSLASQNQSKAGDQWSFFQAKRTRKLIADKTSDLLHSMAVPKAIEPAELISGIARVSSRYNAISKEANQLMDTLRGAKASLGANGAALQQTVAHLAQVVSRNAAAASKLESKTRAELAKLGTSEQVQRIFDSLASGPLPTGEERAIDHPIVLEASRAVRDRRPDDEIETVSMKVPADALQQAIKIADANARVFDDASKPVDKALHALEGLIAEQLRLAHGLYRAVRDVQFALVDLPTGENTTFAKLRTVVDGIAGQAAIIKTAADELNVDFTAARNNFTARRYDGEAHYNQDAAFLYEIRVHQNSALADRHLKRSRNFFYGMLAAQLGVTIATLALAVRQKSLLWALASIAGLGAVLYGIYVYLDLVP